MRTPEALIFDLDGTLYRQDSLRRAMLVRLTRAYGFRPLRGLRTARIISAYRRAQEQLRSADAAYEDLGAAQLRWACERTGSDPEVVSECVSRWIESDPLEILGRYIQPGLLEFLQHAKQRGLGLGLFSDYPADAKLQALGLADIFDVVLTAQSPEVGAFKPDPRGLLLVAERLGVSPAHCAYVGDRAEVDALAARAAAMPCFILTSRVPSTTSDWTPVRNFVEFGDLLERANVPRLAAQPSLDRR